MTLSGADEKSMSRQPKNEHILPTIEFGRDAHRESPAPHIVQYRTQSEICDDVVEPTERRRRRDNTARLAQLFFVGFADMVMKSRLHHDSK